MFMLMAPLAKALRLRTGKDYLLYVLCVCTGGMITHGLTIPHPGPLAMVETLKIDTGLSLAAGLLGGLIPAVVGYVVCVWLNSRNEIPLRDTELSSMESDKPESSLPSFFWSILPVVLPIVLISFSSLFKVMKDGALAADGRQIAWCVSVYETFGQANFDYVKGLVDFFGHKNIALLIGAGISLVVLAKQCGFGLQKLEQLVGPPLETAGMIILITSAGGAFGGMLRAAGVGDAVKASVGSQSVDLILLSFIVAAVIRVAQGSATVAMFTASSIIAPMLGSESIGYNHVYIYLAIGYGAMTCSWMNDSGFWVVSRLSGMTQRETLKTWSVLSICLAVSGLVVTMIFSRLLPLV
jgi:GntP family gluconate:H+ symporter